MGLNAQPVVQLASFSETFVFDTLDPLVPETGNVILTSVSVTTTPSSPSDGVVILPANVVIADITTSTELKANIEGDYGLNIGLDDVYRTVSFTNTNNKLITTYLNYSDLESDTSYSHLFEFLPQNWSFKTFVYTFTVFKTPPDTSTTRTVTQEVYPNMDRHVPRIVSLIEREIV